MSVSLTEQQEADRQLLEEQRDIKYDTKDYTVELLVLKYQKGDFEIPDYQRRFVWDSHRKNKFIESVLLGIPIPVLFGADREGTGIIEIIDGAQRLQTLNAFINGEFKLKGLEKLDSLNNFRFEDIPGPQKSRFKNRTIRIVVLYEKADLHTRIEIFERINTSPMQLEPSEIRKGAFQGKFWDLVLECSGNPLFRKLCPISEPRRKRGEGEELVLRFFAYADRYQDFRHDVSKFLDRYVVDMNQEAENNPEIVEKKRNRFTRMLDYAERCLPYGMKKGKTHKITPRVRFEAIAVGIDMALEKIPNLGCVNTDWLDSPEFERHVRTDASNSGPKLRGRVEYVRDQLLGADNGVG